MRPYLLFLLWFCAASALLSCKHDADVQCYSGVVIGQTCMDGVIIQVSGRTPIGQPVRVYQTYRDSIVGPNAVAATNDLGSLNKVGQTVYFTYAPSPDNRGPSCFCTQDTAPLPIPHVVLNNVSATPCEPLTP